MTTNNLTLEEFYSLVNGGSVPTTPTDSVTPAADPNAGAIDPAATTEDPAGTTAEAPATEQENPLDIFN